MRFDEVLIEGKPSGRALRKRRLNKQQRDYFRNVADCLLRHFLMIVSRHYLSRVKSWPGMKRKMYYILREFVLIGSATAREGSGPSTIRIFNER